MTSDQFGDLKDSNVISLHVPRTSMQLEQQQQTSKQSNYQNIDSSNVASITNSSTSYCQIMIPVTESTSNVQPKHHQIIEKPFLKCQWTLCDRVFVGLKDLRTHVLDVHVDGFDEEDGEDEGEVSVITLKEEDEQSIEQVNRMNPIESTLSEIVSDGQSCASSHDHAYDHQIDHLPSAPLNVSASLICSFAECVDLTFNHQPSLLRHTRLKHSQSLHPIHCKPFSNVRRPTQSNHVLKIVVTSKSKCSLCHEWFECIEVHVIQEHIVMEVVTGEFGECTRTFESDQELERQRAVHQEPEPQFIELLVDYDSNEKSMYEIALEDYTDLDEQSIDEMDCDEEELQQSEHQQTHSELNKSTNEPKSMNSVVENWRPFRCLHCDDSFEKVDDLEKHFEAYHTVRTMVSGRFGECMMTLKSHKQIDRHEGLHQQSKHQVIGFNESTNDKSLMSVQHPVADSRCDYKYNEEIDADEIVSCEMSIEELVYELAKSTNILNQHLVDSDLNSQQPKYQQALQQHQVSHDLPRLRPDEVSDYHILEEIDSDEIDSDEKSLDEENMLELGHKILVKKTISNRSNLKSTESTQNQPNPITFQSNVHLYQSSPPILSKSTQDNCVNEINQSSLNCSECGKYFRDKKALVEHIREVHPKKFHPCEVSGCNKKFKTRSHLFQHYRRGHKGVNFPCKQCKMQNVRNEKNLLHLRTYHEIDFDQPKQTSNLLDINAIKCHKCDKSCKNEKALIDHIRNVHSNKLFPCEVSGCGIKSKKRFNLYSHYRRVHKGVNFPCKQCKILRSEKDLIVDHFRKYHQIDFDVENQQKHQVIEFNESLKSNKEPSDVTVSESNNQVLRKTDQDELDLDELAKLFNENENESYIRHSDNLAVPELHSQSRHQMLEHQPNSTANYSIPLLDSSTLQSNPNPFQPVPLKLDHFMVNLNKSNPNSTKSTPNQFNPNTIQSNVHLNQLSLPTHVSVSISDLMGHHQTHHAINFDYQQFEQQDTELVRSKHNCQVAIPDKSTRKFVCEECGKEFKIRYKLVSHIQTHTGEKPFICPWKDCHKSFARKDKMKVHHIAHNMELPKNLTGHTRSHTKERLLLDCPMKDCGKTFASMFGLKRHLKSHAGKSKTNKKHFCKYCDKTFMESTHLMVHIRTHTGEKPFKCSWKDCDRAFSTKCSLKTYFIRHSMRSIKQQQNQISINLNSNFAQPNFPERVQPDSITVQSHNSLDYTSIQSYIESFSLTELNNFPVEPNCSFNTTTAPSVIQQEEQFVDLKPNTIPEESSFALMENLSPNNPVDDLSRILMNNLDPIMMDQPNLETIMGSSIDLLFDESEFEKHIKSLLDSPTMVH